MILHLLFFAPCARIKCVNIYFNYRDYLGVDQKKKKCNHLVASDHIKKKKKEKEKSGVYALMLVIN